MYYAKWRKLVIWYTTNNNSKYSFTVQYACVNENKAFQVTSVTT